MVLSDPLMANKYAMSTMNNGNSHTLFFTVRDVASCSSCVQTPPPKSETTRTKPLQMAPPTCMSAKNKYNSAKPPMYKATFRGSVWFTTP